MCSIIAPRQYSFLNSKIYLPTIYNFKFLFNNFIWLDSATEKDLHIYLDNEGAFEEEVACRITYQVLKAIEFLHSKQLLHLDIKVATFVSDIVNPWYVLHGVREEFKPLLIEFNWKKNWIFNELLSHIT